MGQITYTVGYLACGHCGTALRGRSRTFGPNQIICGHCGTTIQTNLPAWSDLTINEKLRAAFREFLFPSTASIQGCNALILWPIIHITLCGLLMTVCMVPAAIFMPTDSGDPGIMTMIVMSIVVFVGPLLYPALLVRRLYRLIRESNEPIRTGHIPTW